MAAVIQAASAGTGGRFGGMQQQKKKKKKNAYLCRITWILFTMMQFDVSKGFHGHSTTVQGSRHSVHQRVGSRDTSLFIMPEESADEDGQQESDTELTMSNSNDNRNDPYDDKKISRDNTRDDNPFPFLLPDAFAILLASQLMGLLDVVNDPHFAQAGGWLQPIPAVPSTLGILVQRVALLGVLWIVASTTVSMDDTNRKGTENTFPSWNDGKPLAIFASLRVVVGAIYTILSSSSSTDTLLPDSTDWLASSLRDGYFVALFVVTLRFLYKKLFWY